MKSIKALVIIMGLLILAGLGLLVYGVVGQVSKIAGPGAPSGFDETVVTLPVGCSVVETRVDGDRLVVRTDGPLGYEPCQKIIIIDLQSGEVVGRVSIVTQP
jgi:hypothetical protein